MSKACAIVLVLAMAAPLAVAQPAQTWRVMRDNFSFGHPNPAYEADWYANGGGMTVGKVGNSWWDGRYYCDWSATQKGQLAAALEGDPGVGMQWEVRLEWTRYDDASDYPWISIGFEAFMSSEDWLEGSGEGLGATQLGACHYYSDDLAGANLPWTLEDGTPVASFQDITTVEVNYTKFEGYVPGGSENPHSMQCAVSYNVLNALLTDANCRGIRFLGVEYDPEDRPEGVYPDNEAIAARGLWGSAATEHSPGDDASAWLALYVVEAPPPIDGDLDSDGFVGGLDLNIILSHWGDEVEPGSWPAGDPSGDGFVRGEDLNFVLSHWGNGELPATPVPEPTTMGLLALGGLTLLRRRSRQVVVNR